MLPDVRKIISAHTIFISFISLWGCIGDDKYNKETFEYYRAGVRASSDPATLIRSIPELPPYLPEGSRWDLPPSLIIGSAGIEVRLPQVIHTSVVDISLDNNDEYLVRFFKDGRELCRATASTQLGAGLRTRRIVVPTRALEEGFNAIVVVPWRGDGRYAMGGLRFAK